MLADIAQQKTCALGAPVPLPQTPETIEYTVKINDELVATGTGDAVLGNPVTSPRHEWRGFLASRPRVPASAPCLAQRAPQADPEQVSFGVDIADPKAIGLSAFESARRIQFYVAAFPRQPATDAVFKEHGSCLPNRSEARRSPRSKTLDPSLEGRGLRLGRLNSLVWLAANRPQYGRRLTAGDMVMTGSFTRLFPRVPGDLVQVAFSGVGVVETAMTA